MMGLIPMASRTKDLKMVFPAFSRDTQHDTESVEKKVG